mmetsp:Transcript_81027/g.208583  ORF Transcript_81027/g.208583 Transcript_81027/m.208583 type:complete len:214 (-) Transcript_81027:649-1290(-)
MASPTSVNMSVVGRSMSSGIMLGTVPMISIGSDGRVIVYDTTMALSRTAVPWAHAAGTPTRSPISDGIMSPIPGSTRNASSWDALMVKTKAPCSVTTTWAVVVVVDVEVVVEVRVVVDVVVEVMVLVVVLSVVDVCVVVVNVVDVAVRVVVVENVVVFVDVVAVVVVAVTVTWLICGSTTSGTVTTYVFRKMWESRAALIAALSAAGVMLPTL